MSLKDFSKQPYITLDATIPGQDRIYRKTQVCKTFLLSIFEALITYDTLANHFLRFLGPMISFSCVARKHVFGVSDQVRHNPGCTILDDS